MRYPVEADNLEAVSAKLVRLGLWEKLMPCHWAIKPKGSAIPYFCAVAKGEPAEVRARLMLIEGWQTFHDFMHFRQDPFFGFYSSPLEMPHYELIVLKSGESKLYRDDPGYVPQEVTDPVRRGFCAKLLWEVFGVSMRLETEPELPMRFAAERAVFARVEGRNGRWTDEPLAIPQPRPHVEKVSFSRDLLAKVKDLPFVQEEKLAVDLRIRTDLMTREPRPRYAYELLAVDARSGEQVFSDRAMVDPDGGLRALWEDMPPRLVQHVFERGHVPGEIQVRSARVFRMLRPLCVELPFRLSLHDSLPVLMKNMV